MAALSPWFTLLFSRVNLSHCIRQSEVKLDGVRAIRTALPTMPLMRFMSTPELVLGCEKFEMALNSRCSFLNFDEYTSGQILSTVAFCNNEKGPIHYHLAPNEGFLHPTQDRTNHAYKGP